MASNEPTAAPLSDAQLREVVERAFPETTVETVAATDETPDAFRSDDVDPAWQTMHDAARGGEVAVLIEMLDGTWLRGEERWKAVTFLGRSLRTSEGRRMQEAGLRALAAEAAVTLRDSVPLDAVRVQGAALDAIAGSLASSDAKWQCMLAALEASRSHFGEIVRKLGGFRPSSHEAVTAALPTVIDAMVRSQRTVDLHAVALLVEAMDCRSEASQLRRLLLAANADLSANIARILAAWNDKAAIGEIRRAIDQYHLASDANVDVLVAALYSLDGDRCAEYIADVFRTAPAALQEYMLGNSLAGNRHPAVVRTVRELAATTSDVELKIAADAFLAFAAANPPDTAAIATSLPDEPSTDAEAPPASTENSGWVPTYEGQRTIPVPPAAPDPPAAPPVRKLAEPAAGEEAPWRPSAQVLSRPAPEPVAPRSYGTLAALVIGALVLLAALVFFLSGE